MFLFIESSSVTHLYRVWHDSVWFTVCVLSRGQLVFKRIRVQAPGPMRRPAEKELKRASEMKQILAQLQPSCLPPSIAGSLWLICGRCHPGEHSSLTDRSSGVANKPLKSALIRAAAAESCHGGGCCCCWWGLVVECKCGQYGNDYSSIKGSTLAICSDLKIALNHSFLFKSHGVCFFKDSFCFLAR